MPLPLSGLLGQEVDREDILPITAGRPQARYANPKGYALRPDLDADFSFRVNAPALPGVYGWYVGENLVYIGRARSLRNRLSSQYGTVSPRHPYAGGQLQKCRLNAKLAVASMAGASIRVDWLATSDFAAVEEGLLGCVRPPWNIPVSAGKV